MERYRILPHTADAKFQAFGKTLEEAFVNAALATASLMWEWDKVEEKRGYSIEVEGNDLPQLLSNFLQEIIYLLDTKMFLVSSVENVKIEKKDDRYFLKALFKGDDYSPKYKIYGEVKAITYNEMKIETNDIFSLQVVVDM